MAFGDFLGSFSASSGSITNPFDGTGSEVVAVNDLVVFVVCEQTNATVTGVTDNLGNTYTAITAASDAGAATLRAFYSVVTVAGTLTTLHAACTASNDNVTVVGGAWTGPFAASPLDANPANQVNTDVTSPFTCPATGTLSQADELVVAYGSANNTTAWEATSPNLLAVDNNGQVPKSVLGYQVVSATTSVAPEFTAVSNPGQAIQGMASFKKAAAAGPFTPFPMTQDPTPFLHMRPGMQGY
jgi:hypothetical protein